MYVIEAPSMCKTCSTSFDTQKQQKTITFSYACGSLFFVPPPTTSCPRDGPRILLFASCEPFFFFSFLETFLAKSETCSMAARLSIAARLASPGSVRGQVRLKACVGGWEVDF